MYQKQSASLYFSRSAGKRFTKAHAMMWFCRLEKFFLIQRVEIWCVLKFSWMPVLSWLLGKQGKWRKNYGTKRIGKLPKSYSVPRKALILESDFLTVIWRHIEFRTYKKTTDQVCHTENIWMNQAFKQENIFTHWMCNYSSIIVKILSEIHRKPMEWY